MTLRYWANPHTPDQRAAHCPFCGHPVMAIMLVCRDKTICIDCGEWIVFDPARAGDLRMPTDDEYEEIRADPMARSMREAWENHRVKQGTSSTRLFGL